MYEPHVDLKTPSGEQVIWRYMDFTKFVSILDTKSLFFTRSDRFDDPFEGSITKLHLESRKSSLHNTSNIEEALENWSKGTEKIRESILINCWHMNDYESAAMWRLYLQSSEGIAIKSTVSRFCESFRNSSKSVFVGRVEYIDYQKDMIPWGNILSSFLYKRASFSHENEVRAILWDWQFQSSNGTAATPYEYGVNVDIDLEELIEDIYIPPTAQAWFKDLVVSVLKRYNLNKNVIQSDLNSKPLF